ncbi:ComEC/Rec2 family competence protein [Mesorhizobium sp. CAU 1732]|uniref:ComEC/Rec2 family competence protein n=1 Tax=Mesorhizobium sp. CAU 1732 TaxID=3140358 RepID=UPI0032616F60
MGGERPIATDERRQYSVSPDFASDASLPATRSFTDVTVGPVAGRNLPRPRLNLEALQEAGRSGFEQYLERGNAFLLVPAFMAIGALVYFTMPSEPPAILLVVAAVFAAGCAVMAVARPVMRLTALAALMTLIGMGAAKVETWRALTPMMGAEITTRITGRVARIEHQSSGRFRLTLDVVSTARPELRYAPDRIRATARAIPEGLKPGDTMTGLVRLIPPSGPVRPQSYDFSFKSYFDGIGAIGFFLNNPELADIVTTPRFGDRVRAWIEEQRGIMAGRIALQIGGPEGEIAAALITGVRAGIPEDINEALRVVGLYHVISISGLHMALVAGTLMVGMRCCFALVPAFSSRHPVKKYAAFVALSATAFYLVMSGADVAAQRSFIMLAVMLLAVMVDRAALTMRNLAISAIIILLIAPHEVVGPSFQMSFAATAALVASYAAWTEYRQGKPASGPPPRRSPVASVLRASGIYAAGLSMTSVVAGLATALFTAWHFQQVAPLGLVANLAAMPFVSVIVMPMAVIASILMPFGLEGPALQLMGLGIAAMNAVAIWLAERSVFDMTGAIPLGAVLITTLALAFLTMTDGVMRWAAAPLLAIAAFMLFMRDVPDVIISEDGSLVAMRLEDGRVAVNRPRPRAFTMDNWMRAFAATEIVRPGTAAGSQAEHASGFICNDEGLCIARHGSGGVVAYAATENDAAGVCGEATVIIIDDATAGDPCENAAVLVITKRDLARHGSVEFSFPANGLRPTPRYAIREPYRAWHHHRQFSRAARGMPPYQRENPAEANDRRD